MRPRHPALIFAAAVAPHAELAAGQTVAMTLVNELTVDLRTGAAGPAEVRQRCGPPISQRGRPKTNKG
jgi:hypothetical protein